MSDKNHAANTMKSCTACDTIFENPDFLACPHDGSLLVDATKVDKLIGVTINDRYRIVEQLHRGGTTTIYKGIHDLTERTLAVKVLNEELVRDQIALKRFQQEAQAVSHIQHQCVITVYDYGFIPTSQPYLVMDFLEGETLHSTVVQEGPLNPKRFRRLFWNICGALAQAHDMGIVHRNLKPSNIMLVLFGGDELPKIIDFHLAKLMPASGKSDQGLTQTDEIMGTPLYMSPEQCRTASVDFRSDIYSLGCTMYFALTGEPPFQDDNRVDTMQRHMLDKIPQGALPAEFESIILKAMAKKPEDRWASMDELGEAIGNKPVDKEREGEVRN